MICDCKGCCEAAVEQAKLARNKKSQRYWEGILKAAVSRNDCPALSGLFRRPGLTIEGKRESEMGLYVNGYVQDE